VVVRDAGSHTFVAHAGHGITFRDDISYNNVRDAFWWDPSPNNREPGDPTNDTLIDGSIVARSLGVPDDNRDCRLSAFNLGMYATTPRPGSCSPGPPSPPPREPTPSGRS
jgi:hypothetical protein